MRKGDTILFEAPPSAVAYAAVGGKKEAEGPLADAFDMLIADTQCGEKTWEKAESDFARYCLEAALKKGRLQAGALDDRGDGGGFVVGRNDDGDGHRRAQAAPPLTPMIWPDR